MTVAEQILSVFTGVRGYLDDVELDKIKEFEKGILNKVKNENPEIIEKIESTGKLEDETEKILVQCIEEYKKDKKNA